jgi:N-acetylglucosaminyl-diphospho-decaprenol L-rhamnosyltransferase
MTTVAIVIVAFNARGDLERCLASLTAAPPHVPSEIVVVDNGSTDGAPGMVEARFPSVRLMRAPGNVGFAAGTNLGIRATTSELILLLNPDTVVPAGAVDDLVRELGVRPHAAAVGPRIVDAAGRTEISFGRMPGPVVEARQKLAGRLYDARFPPAAALVERGVRRPRAVDWVSGACLLVRRADADAVGLLDERYFLYWEDVDFCAALRGRGREVWFTPAVTITHVRGQSTAGRARAVTEAYRRGQVAFYEKHHPRWARLARLFAKGRARE